MTAISSQSPRRLAARGPGLFLLAGLFASTASAEPLKKLHNPEDPNLYVGSETCGACHDAVYEAFKKSPHAATLAGGPKYPPWLSGCEACHGPGKAHVEAGGGAGSIRSPRVMPSVEKTEICMQCHGGQDERINFRRSEHANANVSCDSCHDPHGAPGTQALLRKPATELCLGCHGEIRTSFQMPFHHKVPEGAMSCVDCHNQHGGFTVQQRLVGTDRACLKCHGDKKGPFTFEHLGVAVEGCAACHTPHGSNNPRLLTRSQVRFLCLECHSGVEGTFGVSTPSFHNLNNPRYFSCTTCHVMIHGSNLSKTFFE